MTSLYGFDSQEIVLPPKSDKIVIELEGVEKSFGNRKILQGLDVKIQDGETFVIIGRSGTGKSVTFKHMVGLLKPDKGRVILNGKDITKYSKDQLIEVRKGFGLLFQDGALLKWMTVAENVALPLKEHTKMKADEIKKTVMEKLDLVEMAHTADQMPDQLSGGQKKRAGLARAIVLDPDVVLYDEPTSGLDPIMSNTINELIMNLQKKLRKTSVVVTHDMNSAYMIANRVGMLYEGKLIQIGTPGEIKESTDKRVIQFITGATSGPITDDIKEGNLDSLKS